MGSVIQMILYLFSFQALRRIGQDHLILMLCVTVFLSYLPEAGEYSCFFVYLQLVCVNVHRDITFRNIMHLIRYIALRPNPISLIFNVERGWSQFDI